MPSATKKVSLVRRSQGHYTATNARGGQIQLGSGQDAEFTPVELLLAAIGGCSSIDVDTVTSRRGNPPSSPFPFRVLNAATTRGGYPWATSPSTSSCASPILRKVARPPG